MTNTNEKNDEVSDDENIIEKVSKAPSQMPRREVWRFK